MNSRRKNIRWYFLLVIFSTAALVWYAVLRESRGTTLMVSFLSVGQGDAIFIEAPNGNQVLLDGGPTAGVLRALAEVMPFYDRSIDMIIVSNPDRDHIAGFIDVLDRYKVDAEVEPGTRTSTAVYAALVKAVHVEGLETLFPKAGDTFVLDEKHGVRLEILYPDRDLSTLSTNAGSIVAKLSYGDTCFILTGDTIKSVEEHLTETLGEKLDCEVLKVAHHGSKTSSSPKFVEAVSPEYAVISVGKDNKYGHPHQETLDTLSRQNISVLRTDIVGTIRFVSNGKSVWQK